MKTIVIDDEYIEKINKKLNIDRIERELLSEGIPIPTRPKNKFDIPENLPDLSMDAVAQLFAEVNAWAHYANYEVSKLDIMKKRQEEIVKTIFNLVYLQQEKELKDIMNAKTEANVYVKKANSKLDFLTAKYKLMKSLCDNYWSSIETLNREINRRHKEFEKSVYLGNLKSKSKIISKTYYNNMKEGL